MNRILLREEVRDQMAERKTKSTAERRVRGTGAEEIATAQAQQAGSNFQWHFGRVTRLGSYEVANYTVTILWEEGGISSQQGEITAEQWEILKLAFLTSGRIAVLSPLEENDWMYDYRFIEAVR